MMLQLNGKDVKWKKTQVQFKTCWRRISLKIKSLSWKEIKK